MIAFAYAKYVALAAILVTIFAAGWHLGELGPREALAASQAAGAQAALKAAALQRQIETAAQTQVNQAEATHTHEIETIADTHPVTAPVRLCGPSRAAANHPVPVAGQADGVGAGPDAGTVQPGPGDGDLRPALEALKRKYETVLADYRQLDAAWPQAAAHP